MHWHPNADEWQYYVKGSAQMTVFNAGPKAVTTNFKAGDVGYVKRSLGHYIKNIGDSDLVFLEVFALGRLHGHFVGGLVVAHAAGHRRGPSRPLRRGHRQGAEAGQRRGASLMSADATRPDAPAPGAPTRREIASGFGVLAVLGLAHAARAQSAARALAPAGMQPASQGPRIFLTDAEAAFVEAAVGAADPGRWRRAGRHRSWRTQFHRQATRRSLGPRASACSPAGLSIRRPRRNTAISSPTCRPNCSAVPWRRSPASPTAPHFPTASPQTQDHFLSSQLENGGAGDLDGVPAALFFEHLLDLTVQGYFSDPAYGGNKDMVSWKAIGFPGAYDAYRDTVGQHGKTFEIGPFAMSDHDAMPADDMAGMEKQK